MKNKKGFTLIEVLIALAILSIALTAIIKATAQNTKDLLYLQNKTVAAWVGTQVINEVRAGILKLPLAPDHLIEETTMLGQAWSWEASLKKTANAHIEEIDVAVYQKQTQEKLIHFISYQIGFPS